MADRVLVTGAAGVLGGAIARALSSTFDVTATDMLEINLPLRSVTADLSKPDQARRACEGIDVVVHAAAIHPWRKYSPDQYLDWNIKATYHLLASAAEAGVKRVIYTSSIGAMGYRADSPSELPFDEAKPCRPQEDLYGVTKHVGEQFCHLFANTRGLKYVILRPGYFVPRDEMDPNVGILYLTSRVFPEDVVRAHVLAVQRPDLRNETFVITADMPFTQGDAEALKASPASVITRYFPRAEELFRDPAFKPRPITYFYCIAKAKRLLGWQPQMNFSQWLERYLEWKKSPAST